MEDLISFEMPLYSYLLSVSLLCSVQKGSGSNSAIRFIFPVFTERICCILSGGNMSSSCKNNRNSLFWSGAGHQLNNLYHSCRSLRLSSLFDQPLLPVHLAYELRLTSSLDHFWLAQPQLETANSLRLRNEEKQFTCLARTCQQHSVHLRKIHSFTCQLALFHILFQGSPRSGSERTQW